MLAEEASSERSAELPRIRPHEEAEAGCREQGTLRLQFGVGLWYNMRPL